MREAWANIVYVRWTLLNAQNTCNCFLESLTPGPNQKKVQNNKLQRFFCRCLLCNYTYIWIFSRKKLADKVITPHHMTVYRDSWTCSPPEALRGLMRIEAEYQGLLPLLQSSSLNCQDLVWVPTVEGTLPLSQGFQHILTLRQWDSVHFPKLFSVSG